MLLLNPPLLADNRVGVEKDFDLRVWEDFRPDVAPFHYYPAVCSQFALAGHHPLAKQGMDRDARRGCRNIGLAHAQGDVAAIEQHAVSPERWLNLDPRFVGEVGERR